VVELADALVASDLGPLAPQLMRHAITLGAAGDGSEVRIPAYGVNVLLAGTSGSGKSTFATAFLERLAGAGRQFCIVDPEGDYRQLDGAVVLGDRNRPASIEEVLTLLARPDQNAVVNLLGVGVEERPQFFGALFSRLQELRSRTGRPHWIILDETHHLVPASLEPGAMPIPADLHGLMLITVHPDHVSRAILSTVDLIIVIGETPQHTLATFAATLGAAPPEAPHERLEPGEAIGWWRHDGGGVFRFRGQPPKAERRRHVRKYAEGELGPDRSFYFRGPEEKLNLRAQNLVTFLQLAEGVDDATWEHHLRRGDYSQWFRSAIKDEALASATSGVEQAAGLSPAESRRRIRALLEELYTAPA
jgi:hypothetical protein